VEIVCPNCKRRNAEGRRYCTGCGINLGDAVPKDAQHVPQYETHAPQTLRQRLAGWLRRVRRVHD
jgi:uncharacterized membrane protein YvbJ